MSQTDDHDLVQRTEDSIKRFVQYDKSVEADPAFRATVGASQPKVASSLLPPPKVGKWKVKVVDMVEAEKQQPVKTLHRHVRSFPTSDHSLPLDRTYRKTQRLVQPGASEAAGAGQGGGVVVVSDHSYAPRRSNALPDRCAAALPLKSSSLDKVLRIITDVNAEAQAQQSLGKCNVLNTSSSSMAPGTRTMVTTQRVLDTTQLSDISRAVVREKEEELFKSEVQDNAPAFYPLQYFDDMTMDSRSMQEWMQEVLLLLLILLALLVQNYKYSRSCGR
jgi:hypothetical protein